MIIRITNGNIKSQHKITIGNKYFLDKIFTVGKVIE